MKGSKKLNQLLEDNEKKLKKLFKYDKKEALSFTKEDREKVEDQFGIYVIFDGKNLSLSAKLVVIQLDINRFKRI